MLLAVVTSCCCCCYHLTIVTHEAINFFLIAKHCVLAYTASLSFSLARSLALFLDFSLRRRRLSLFLLHCCPKLSRRLQFHGLPFISDAAAAAAAAAVVTLLLT